MPKLRQKCIMPAMRWRAAIVLSTLILIGSPLRAEDGEPSTPPAAEIPNGPRIAILLLAIGEAPADLGANLTEVLVATVADMGQARIIGSEEFQTMLAREGNEALSCLESTTCLGRVAVQLNIQQVIAGSIGLRPNGFAFHLTRTDVTSGRVAGRLFREVEGGVSELIAAIRESAVRLLEDPEEPGSVRVECDVAGATVYLDDELLGNAPVNRAGVAPGTHTLRVEADDHLPWRRDVEVSPGVRSLVQVALEAEPQGTPVHRGIAAATWLLVGLGVAGLGAAGAFGLVSQQELPEGISRAEAVDELSTREDYAWTANILFSAGGTLLLAGVLWLIFDWRRAFGAPPEEEDESATSLLLGGAPWAW